MRSCLRAEAIKSVAARGDKISYAHGQANNFLVTKRLAGAAFPSKTRSMRSTWPRVLWPKTPSPLLHQLNIPDSGSRPST